MEAAVFPLLALLFLSPSAVHSAPFPKPRTLYEIACTMCSTCCNPVPASPPPPPPPSPPPPSSVAYCPPPPAKSYSPPPPSTYTYSSPPPPQGGSGCFSGSCFNYPPPDYGNYPAPPPPNPIVPYFPFYFYNPPPASMSGSFKLAGGAGLPAVVGVLLFFM